MKYYKVVYTYRGILHYFIIFCDPSLIEKIFQYYVRKEKINYDTVDFFEWSEELENIIP